MSSGAELRGIKPMMGIKDTEQETQNLTDEKNDELKKLKKIKKNKENILREIKQELTQLSVRLWDSECIK